MQNTPIHNDDCLLPTTPSVTAELYPDRKLCVVAAEQQTKQELFPLLGAACLIK